VSGPFALASPLQPSAEFSTCRRYRYTLRWPAKPDGTGTALFILANPSTATAERTDPTVSKCIGYAARWGYQWCLVMNVRAWRETDPRKVPPDPLAISEPGEPALNDDWIQREAMRAGIVICGWGQLGADRAVQVLSYLRAAGVVPMALALNDDGTPRHPLARGKLRLPPDVRPVRIPMGGSP
jgi:hypothetical protein